MPLAYRMTSFVLDRALAKARFVLWPLRMIAALGRGASAGFALLVNEGRKADFASCGRGVRIYGRFKVTAPRNLHVGDNVHINANALLRAEGGLFIGDNVHISRNLVVYTLNHNYAGACLPYDCDTVEKPVRIERNVWIGINVVVVPGVTIGEGAIVGMGTVVSRDVAPLEVVGSPPPRVLKCRDAEHYRAVDTAGHYGGMSGYRWREAPLQVASASSPDLAAAPDRAQDELDGIGAVVERQRT